MPAKIVMIQIFDEIPVVADDTGKNEYSRPALDGQRGRRAFVRLAENQQDDAFGEQRDQDGNGDRQPEQPKVQFFNLS